MTLNGTHILLGISGGIAAYKAPILVRELTALGAAVQVVMTASAAEFVTATSLQAVSGQPVRSDLWDPQAEAAMGHIELARWADILLIAPATANTIAKLANGQADDLLSTLALATQARLVLAPAMNQAMWRHPATSRNCQRLQDDGALLLGPDSGAQACGDVGPGRMLEPHAIGAALQTLVASTDSTDSNDQTWGLIERPEIDVDQTIGQILETGPDLSGARILITAGPTREALDPVRYLSNRSSGKQGFALAAAAAACGAEVTLVAGPVALTTPDGVTRVDVLSAQDMFDAVLARAPGQDVVIGVAAVADYRPAQIKERKIKKTERSAEEKAADPDGRSMTLELVENPDIIASVAALAGGPLTVGFAAETHETLRHAREKRARKGLDLIVVNDVSRQDIGFGSDHNAATLISAEHEQALERMPKAELALAILTAIDRQLHGRVSRAG
ncbi:MAG: bifunctional phosphopantothenoylcysteine decarboxylase/phosphopantothenate--cysteine ligase CoaBC [Pseudomonadales bacterium]